jgi:lipid II isoglutaminyl synthase (glutamine-hydrolysing)
VIGIGLVRPDLLGTYGDGGNATVLAQRLARRGRPARVVPLTSGGEVGDDIAVLVMGGGEDAAQRAILRDTRLAGSIRRAADRGVPVLAVCAGIQILGHHFDDGDGVRQAGLGLLDVETDRLAERAVGEVVVEPISALDRPGPLLTGFENHGGRTIRGRDCHPLGLVRVGVGNGDGTDGVVSGHLVGTYLHGPVLARNPALADQLLEWALGPLEPLSMPFADQLHDERIAAAPIERAALSGSRRRRPGRPASRG